MAVLLRGYWPLLRNRNAGKRTALHNLHQGYDLLSNASNNQMLDVRIESGAKTVQGAKSGGCGTDMKTFLITFYCLTPEAKAELFARHGLTGADQTALHLYVYLP
jgi:hypothetical protein